MKNFEVKMGGVRGSIVTIGENNSIVSGYSNSLSQAHTESGIPMEEIQKLVKVLQANLEWLPERERISLIIDKLNAQSHKKKPNDNILKSLLLALKAIVVGASGNLFANMVADLLSNSLFDDFLS